MFGMVNQGAYCLSRSASRVTGEIETIWMAKPFIAFNCVTSAGGIRAGNVA
jgi:hypothetical protein